MNSDAHFPASAKSGGRGRCVGLWEGGVGRGCMEATILFGELRKPDHDQKS